MPEIPDVYLNSIVTLLVPPFPVGTGFLVRMLDAETGIDNRYLVTCQHCIEKDITARFCTGLTSNFAPHEWTYSPTGDDVVAIDLTDRLLPADAFGYIDSELLSQNNKQFYGLGCDLYMLGTFVSERDVGKNVPRARFGNLSALADEYVLVKQGNGSSKPMHLADMRSRTGFSGSPVLGYIYIPGLSGSAIYREKLLGVHSAQYDERIKIVGQSREFDLDIPSSMTKVVPAERVLDLLNTADFMNARNKRAENAANGTSLAG